MVLPSPGTPAFEQFMMRARDPKSVEANILKQMNDDAANDIQNQVRQMLHTMIDLVPGQLFRDIGRFHAKFGLEPTENLNHELPENLVQFRINFMLEELLEYCDAVGIPYKLADERSLIEFEDTQIVQPFNPEQAFDALIDLVYVALGTAYLHRFPFNEGWTRVQEANMAKVRADGSDDPRSKRKHSADIVKPEGWKPPVLSDLLGKSEGSNATTTEGPNS